MSVGFEKHEKGMYLSSILKHYGYELKWAWQRATKGHDDRDAWCIRSWFSEELETLLLEMKENLHSYANNMTYEEWKAALDHFYDVTKRFNEMQNHPWEPWANDEYAKTKKEMLDLFVIYFDDLWD